MRVPIVAAVSVLVLGLRMACAAETENAEATRAVDNGATAAAAEEGFRPLFDGKTLAGWQGHQDWFRVEAATIVAGSLRQKIARNEYITSRESYDDFELRLEFRIMGGVAEHTPNAGIQFRSERVPNSNEMVGYQADIGFALKRELAGCLYDERRHKLLAGPEPETSHKLLSRKGWNEYVIRCEGPRVRLWLNGTRTVDYTELDPSIPRTGVIGLQIHAGPAAEARYRNIRLKRLSQ